MTHATRQMARRAAIGNNRKYVWWRRNEIDPDRTQSLCFTGTPRTPSAVHATRTRWWYPDLDQCSPPLLRHYDINANYRFVMNPNTVLLLAPPTRDCQRTTSPTPPTRGQVRQRTREQWRVNLLQPRTEHPQLAPLSSFCIIDDLWRTLDILMSSTSGRPNIDGRLLIQAVCLWCQD